MASGGAGEDLVQVGWWSEEDGWCPCGRIGGDTEVVADWARGQGWAAVYVKESELAKAAGSGRLRTVPTPTVSSDAASRDSTSSPDRALGPETDA